MHFAKPIEAVQVQLSDVLPEDKIEELTKVFKANKEDSLSELMEKNGDKFTWNEMRMFKESLN